MAIEAEGLVKEFGPRRAVDAVSFSIGPGELVGLIGPNGAGKTTLLRLLTTFLSPTSGRAAIAGFDCQTESFEVRRRLGYLPETLVGDPEARVEEYLQFRARLKEIPRRQVTAEVARVVEACDLLPVQRRLLGNLSQGFRRRVGLADTLLGHPPVLILDEPTIGLDPLQVRQFRTVLSGLVRDGYTVLLSTHLLAEAESLCERVLMLLDGRLVADVNLADRTRDTAFEVEIQADAVEIHTHLAALPQVTGVTPVSELGNWSRFLVRQRPPGDIRPEVAALCQTLGWPLRELRAVQPSLEDQFVRFALQSRSGKEVA